MEHREVDEKNYAEPNLNGRGKRKTVSTADK